MKPIKRVLKFGLEKRKGKINNLPIRLRVSFLSQRIDIGIGHNCDQINWVGQTVKEGKVNKVGTSSTIINEELSVIKIAVDNVFKLAELQDRIPEKNEIKNAVNSIKNKDLLIDAVDKIKDGISLFEVFNEFVEKSSKLNNWSLSTHKKFKTVRKHLKEFKTDLSFEYLDQNGISDYLIFLQKQKKMRNSTVLKQWGFLKWFLRWSYNNDYTDVEEFKKFKTKFKNTRKKVIFLTEDEKNKIIETIIPAEKKRLEQIRDVLMFSCYTGLRYSDIYNLKQSDIKNNHIELTTVKTSDSLIIELNKHSRKILDKYKDIPFKNEKVLPVISNQKMNDYLKDLGQLAGINEKIRITHYEGSRRIENVYPKYHLMSTHIGRRTFIITALSLGIPADVVMKWTGHSDYKAMKPYIDIADKTKKNEMAKFNAL